MATKKFLESSVSRWKNFLREANPRLFSDSNPCTGKTSERLNNEQEIDEFKSAELLNILFDVDRFSYKIKL